MKLYQAISRQLDRIARAKAEQKPAWQEDAEATLDRLLALLPSGSGFNHGVKLYDHSTPEKLIFTADFQHMDEAGFYSGWSFHQAIVTPSLIWDFSIRVTGRDRNRIKEYIGDTLTECLRSDVDSF